MNIIHNFNHEFCDNILNSLNNKKRIVLQYDREDFINTNNDNVYENQPTDADCWQLFNDEYTLKVQELINNNVEEVEELMSYVQRLDTTKKSRPHTDSYNYTSVLLLNDNFKGGELIIKNKPCNLKKGNLIIFNSNNIHYVDKLTDGERYTLVTFIKTKDKTKKSLL